MRKWKGNEDHTFVFAWLGEKKDKSARHAAIFFLFFIFERRHAARQGESPCSFGLSATGQQ
jgi:hypothetical protein